MNRTRFNHQRADRDIEGLQQVPQMPQQTPLSPVRKTTYTRAELMQRGPGAAATRSKRLSTLNPGNRQTSASDAAANRRTSNMTRAHFLPRVAQMGTNNLSNNNALLNTGKQARDARKPPKSSSYLPSTFGAKLPQQQQHQQQQQQQQLLSVCSASSSLSNSSNDLRKIKLAKAFRLPDEQNKSFVYLCKPVKKVKELLMVRTLHNSVDNLLHESATDELSNECFNPMQLELPTLLSATAAAAESDTCSYCSSLNLPHELAELSSAASSSYRGLLETQLQDVRTREQQLQQLAEQVQREQLSAGGEQKEQQQLTQQQLQQQSQQEHRKGEQQSQQQSMNEQQQHKKGEQQSQQQSEQQQSLKGQQQSLSEQQQSQQHSLKGQQQQPQPFQSSTPQQHLSPQQPESLQEPSAKIDYVCHNIPTLQREIILLQQLGEKLEATLRANMQHAASVTATSLQPRSLPQSPHDSRTSFYTPRSTLTLFGCDARLHIQQLGWRRVQQQPPHVWQLARVLGCRCSYGCIREFRIETKTLTELKMADETECFYLPLARDGSLQRTSFRKLRENPNVLLQQLRPLTPSRPFNLLEQDAMFFNSMMSHGVAASKLPRETGGEQVQLALRHPPDDVARLLLVATVNATVQCEFPSPPAEATKNQATKSKSLASLKTRPSLSRWKRRVAVMRQPPHLVARVRQVTPLRPQRVELEPRVQTQLLKTVLVGIAQVAVFLVLIMAFSYPDIRC